MGAWTWAVGVLVGLAACNKGATDEASAADLPSRSGAGSESPEHQVPQTRATFLALLAEIPDAPLHVHYVVSGPRMSGTLDLWVDDGGYRREAWSLKMPSSLKEGADLVDVSGVAIQTPEFLWSGADGETGVKMKNPLGRIADGYLALSLEDKTAVSETLYTWRESLVAARSEAPGATDSVLGIGCLEMHVASQDLCLWEEAGLPLRYRGEVFVLEAQTVARHAELPDRAFAVPGAGVEVEAEAGDGTGLKVDPEQALEKLKSGDPGPVALALTPAFRLPTPSP